MNFQGELITEAIYDGIFNFSDGLAAAYKGLDFGYLDQKGIEVIPFTFAFAEPLAMDMQW